MLLQQPNYGAKVQALVQEHYDTCAYARPLFYTAVHEAVLGGPPSSSHAINASAAEDDGGSSFYASKASMATAQLKAGSATELQAKCGTRSGDACYFGKVFLRIH